MADRSSSDENKQDTPARGFGSGVPAQGELSLSGVASAVSDGGIDTAAAGGTLPPPQKTASGEAMSTAKQVPDYESSVRWIMRNGVGIQVMEAFAVGTILSAFALQLGANNLVIGLLAAIPNLSQLAQLPGVWLVDRYRKRRTIYWISGWVARPMMLVIGACAFLPPGNLALGVMMGAFVIRYMAGAMLGVAWNSWMRDLIPDDRMGQVFGERARIMIAIGASVTLLAGGFIDVWKHYVDLPEHYAFAVVYTLSFFGGIYAVWCSRFVREPPLAPIEEVNLFDRLRQPLRDKNFTRLLKFNAAWSFAVNLAAPFFAVLMLKGMNLPVTWVVFLATLSQVAGFLTVRTWGALGDRMSNKAVLSFCGPLFIACVFAWTFATKIESHWTAMALLVAIHVFTGVSSAGVGLASGNIGLKLAPRGDSTAYLATSAVINATSAGIASVVGGLTADFFAVRHLELIVHWQSPVSAFDVASINLTYWDFFFVSATVLGLYSLHRLSFVEEEGHEDDHDVGDVLATIARRRMRTLTTVTGLRTLTEFPIELVRKVMRRERDEDEP